MNHNQKTTFLSCFGQRFDYFLNHSRMYQRKPCAGTIRNHPMASGNLSAVSCVSSIDDLLGGR